MKLHLTPNQPNSQITNPVLNRKIISPPNSIHPENTASQFSSLTNDISVLTQNVNDKFKQMMTFFQNNVNPKQVNENSQNITMIQKQLRQIHNRLDQIQHRKETSETDSENNLSKYDSDDEMEELSQNSNTNIEQTEIKIRKGNNLFTDEFPMLRTPDINDNIEYDRRC